MNPIIERIMGLDKLTDEMVAMDFLISAKTGVRNYAMAVTECASPEIKSILIQQLEEAVDTHEKIIGYMMERGFYKPYEMNEQIERDLTNIQTALNIPS
ncbi:MULTISPECIES: spore coat protein [Paenibacillus]|uniref:Spore coat protein n=1 Tax=Paenibacillus campinasensis TaxID=66347 RepID=A0A268EVJ2_9BACL|nr:MULTISPECIES: spore coat protein [Paenibacillus]MUG67851.1 spore coat protein [Paenibacillus campinasensis]PAD77137.1 spore coat protein [Paenibacillus campinasensis]PAK48577.1 spore coat protein [Paenibacillus sp. 7541]